MNINDDKLVKAVRELLISLGEDVEREGLRDTPKRVARAYAEILEGYSRSLKDEITVFQNTSGYDDIIYSGPIDFYSTCEHHLLPFFGKAHVAYIPDTKIIGLSKLSRAVDIFSRRLQDQERITMQVADELSSLLKPKGVAIILEAKHLCNSARGVKQTNATMTTAAFKGIFKDDPVLSDRFMSMARK